MKLAVALELEAALGLLLLSFNSTVAQGTALTEPARQAEVGPPRALQPGAPANSGSNLTAPGTPKALPALSHDPAWRRRRMEVRERRAEQEYRRRAFPLEQVPPGATARALAEIQQADDARSPGKGPGFSSWYALGPAPINTTDNGFFEPVSGRVPVVAVDPSNSSHWLIGGAQGGIWETFDQGADWAARTDDQASLAMGAITFAPSNPLLIYAGTGEQNFSADSFAGQGLLISRDGGTNWQMLNTNFAETAFSHIQVDPASVLNLVATTVRGVAGLVSAGTNIPPQAPPRGVFTSSDGGTNFTRVLTGEATALAVDPSQFKRQYAGLAEIFGAATNGVYRTTNNWASYELIPGPWTALAVPTNSGRIAMAISSSGGTLYVGIANKRNGLPGLEGIWSTTNPWSPVPTWTALPTPSVGYYSWYSFELIVDPNNAGRLYLAEFTVQQYQSGVWSDIGSNIHPDNHAMAWVPWGGGSWRMLLGNDGGAWLSTTYPPNSNWSDLNTTLSLSQIYKGAVAPAANDAFMLAGTQDNGVAANPGALAWNGLFGGDGGDCAISASDPDNSWAISVETYGTVDIYRTVDAGTNFVNVSSGIDPANAPFFVHFEKAPHNDDLFIAGTAQLWRCTNFFSATTPQWHSNSPIMFDNQSQPVYLSAMAFAPSDTSGRIYAFGTEVGQMRLTTDAGGTWHALDPANQVPARFITGLAFSPTDTNVLFVSLSGFNEGTPLKPGHLFRTTNAMAATPNWVNIGPPVNLPHDCLAISPGGDNSIIVGTDIGTWTTADGGGSWAHQGPISGMPNVAVFDLRMNAAGRPTAFTHGRGAFTFAQPIPIPINEITFQPPFYEVACLTCPPTEWINPGDLVEIQVTLENILPVNTVNLVGTILPSAEITPVVGRQSFGVLGQWAAATRQFSFQAHLVGKGGGRPPPGTCGGAGIVVLQLQDGTNNLGQVNVPFRLGVPSFPLRQDFINARPPALPQGWTSAITGGDAPWLTTSNWPPNAVHPEAPDEPLDPQLPFAGPPVYSAFTPDAIGSGESFLFSPLFTPATSQAQLFFRHAFTLNNGYDGGRLEIAVGSQGFVEITQAGGSFSRGSYNGLAAAFSPLAPQPAWTGNSGGWTPVYVNLPAAAVGQPVQLRWHLATVRGLTSGGWYVNSFVVTEAQCLPPVSNPVIVNPALRGNVFTFAIDTVATRTYLIECKTNLTDSTWGIIQTLSGNGNRQTVTVPIGTNRQAFYRFQVP